MSVPRAEALESAEKILLASAPSPFGEFWNSTRDKLAQDPVPTLPTVFPSLRRRAGAEAAVDPQHAERFLRGGSFVLDLAAYRRADLAACLLFAHAREHGLPEATLRELFDHGDIDERVSALRCLPLVEDASLVRQLAAQAQRSNTMDVVEAAFCDHDTMARHLDEDDFNRLVLKLAFADLPFWRVLGGLSRANVELSRMLQEFATEREAAGRPVWDSTLPLIARCPIEGSVPRLLGALEHGRDSYRLAAAEALGILGRPEWSETLKGRLPREAHPPVREAIEASLRSLGESIG